MLVGRTFQALRLDFCDVIKYNVVMSITNKKHQEFINNLFLFRFNATDAYEATYPKATRESARREASRLLTNVDISEEITRRLKEKHLTADMVLHHLSEQANSDHAQYFTVNGDIDIKKLIADGKGHLIHEIEPTKYGRKIKFYDAQSALSLVGKQLGLFTDRHIVDIRLEKEVEQILNVLEEVLSPDDYQRILARLGSGSAGPAETTEPDNSGR